MIQSVCKQPVDEGSWSSSSSPSSATPLSYRGEEFSVIMGGENWVTADSAAAGSEEGRCCFSAPASNRRRERKAHGKRPFMESSRQTKTPISRA